jgi:hypothetical protein
MVNAQVRVRDLAPRDGHVLVTHAPRRGMKDARVRLEARRNDRAGILREWMQALRDPVRGRQVVDVFEWHRDTVAKARRRD